MTKNKKQSGFIGNIYDQPELEKSMPVFAGIKKKNRNKFVETYKDKNKTSDLLKHIKYEHIESMVKYLLFENHPCRDNKLTTEVQRFLNYIDPECIPRSIHDDLYDKIVWCKGAIKAYNEQVPPPPGTEFLSYIDDYGAEKSEETGHEFIDVVKNVKNDLPIDEYIEGMTPEDTLKWLSKEKCASMRSQIKASTWACDYFLDQSMDNLERLKNEILIDGNFDAIGDFEKAFNKKMVEIQKYNAVNNTSNLFCAVNSGFTAGLKKDDCIAENRRNRKQAETGCNKFRFGMRWLNLVTGGGIESKQLMVFGAPSGNGKTSMLISSAIDMALYNPNVKYDKKYTPCVLYISAETGLNDIKSRYIKMMTGQDISWDDEENGEKCYLNEDEIEELLVESSNILERATPTKIRFIQVPNGAYTKNEIMRDIEQLKEKEGLQVVALVADYIKGFRPTINSTENRLYVENTVTDLRAVAIECDVAVLTASQIKGEVSEEISNKRSRYETDVIPDCNEYVFSETKGVLECCDFGVLLAQTSNKYETLESTGAIKYTHLEAMVLKTRSGAHNRAKAFIPYVEGSQVAFQKDVDVTTPDGKPVWFTKGELKFIGDPNKKLISEGGRKLTTNKLFTMENANKASAQCNLQKEKDVLDSLGGETFFNEELRNVA